MAWLRHRAADFVQRDAVPEHHTGFEALNGYLLAFQPRIGIVGAQLAHHLLGQRRVHFFIQLNVSVEVVRERVELARGSVAQLVHQLAKHGRN